MKILIDMTIHESSFKVLETMPDISSVIVAEGDHEDERVLPESLIANVEAILCTQLPLNHDCMRKLGYVQISSSGYAQLEGLDLPKRGVIACNARGVQDIPIAEWTIAMMVNLSRDLLGMMRNQQRGIWDRDDRFQVEIFGKTIGIWGYGGLGRQIARLAKASGLRVHALSCSPIRPTQDTYVVEGQGDPLGVLPDHVFGADEVAAFCKELDFLCLTMPLTPQTRGIIDHRVFEWLPRSAFLLNPARGPLVVEADLLEALKSSSIAGAALDTHFIYPLPPSHPLWSMSNVILTPHISGSSRSPHFSSRVWDIFLRNLQRLYRGQSLLNRLRPDQLGPSCL